QQLIQLLDGGSGLLRHLDHVLTSQDIVVTVARPLIRFLWFCHDVPFERKNSYPVWSMSMRISEREGSCWEVLAVDLGVQTVKFLLGGCLCGLYFLPKLLGGFEFAVAEDGPDDGSGAGEQEDAVQNDQDDGQEPVVLHGV